LIKLHSLIFSSVDSRQIVLSQFAKVAEGHGAPSFGQLPPDLRHNQGLSVIDIHDII
jgi:hypothetical protein